jgi:hypothetical protein
LNQTTAMRIGSSGVCGLIRAGDRNAIRRTSDRGDFRIAASETETPAVPRRNLAVEADDDDRCVAPGRSRWWPSPPPKYSHRIE